MTYTGTLANCTTLNALQNKLQGLPLIGEHVGGGIHVDMPKTWDGTGPTPPGWTAYGQSSTRFVNALSYVAELDPITQDPNAVATLSPADKTSLSSVLAAGTVAGTAVVVDSPA